MIRFFLLFISFSSFAQVVFEESLAETFEKAKIQNKAVFIEYYNSECPVCKKLGIKLQQNDEVSSFYNENFINYAMNTNGELSKEEKELLETANLHFESVPMLLFFDEKKNFLHYSGVNLNSDAIIEDAQKALNPNKRASSLQSKYENGDRSVRTLYAYCNLLVINKNEEILNKISQELFESFKKEELPTKKSYIILKQIIHSTENGFFQYWITNLAELKGFEKESKEGTEKLALEKIVLNELSDPKIKNWKKNKKEAFKKYILALKIADNPEVYFE